MKKLMGTVATGIACLALLNGNNVQAQQQSQSQSGRFGRGNFDPSQYRQRRMDEMKDRLEIKDDSEWKAIQPLVEKVMDAQRAVLQDRIGGMFGSRRSSSSESSSSSDSNSSDRRRFRGGFGGEPSPEAEALQKAIDAKASNSEMKTAIARFQDARKKKMADLEQAQANLKAVLSVRQEAIATSAGLL